MSVFFCNCDMKDIHNCGNREERWSGKVVDTFEENGYDDSDFIALVWDDEIGATRKVCYASTRSWTYHNGVSVDATPEVLEKALRWYREAWIVKAIESAGADLRKPRRGSVVRSITTRGPNVGVTGEVRWTGPGKYGPRVGIHVEGRKGYVFMAESSVEVVDAAPVDEQEIRDHAVNIDPGWKAIAQMVA